MAKNSKKVAAISLEMSLMGILEPVIQTLDKHYYDDAGRPNELHGMGHELPSRKDGMLRVLVNNFCRDIYQQIHGVKTETYNFSGIKDNFDRAANAIAALELKYQHEPDLMDGDPNIARTMDWYESSEVKLSALQTLLDEVASVYKNITGDDWVYTPPGSRQQTKRDPKEAAQALRERLAARLANKQAASSAA